MPMLTFMADVLRAAGLTVREVPGWQTRGHGAMSTVLGVLAHHTAGGAVGDFPSENIVVNGRAGLAGPLCNLGLTRSGTWVVVAAGQAWHAGTGSVPWCPANNGNSRLIGVEAESVGTRDDWTAAQRESYPRGVAALLRHLRLPADRVIGHREWSPGRKIDPAFWDMNAFRDSVARHLTAGPEDSMSQAEVDQIKKHINLQVGFARDQILTALGVDQPANAPAGRSPEGNAAMAPARRAEVGRALDALAGLAKAPPAGDATTGPVALTDADVARIAAAVLAELSKRTA